MLLFVFVSIGLSFGLGDVLVQEKHRKKDEIREIHSETQLQVRRINSTSIGFVSFFPGIRDVEATRDGLGGSLGPIGNEEQNYHSKDHLCNLHKGDQRSDMFDDGVQANIGTKIISVHDSMNSVVH